MRSAVGWLNKRALQLSASSTALPLQPARYVVHGAVKAPTRRLRGSPQCVWGNRRSEAAHSSRYTRRCGSAARAHGVGGEIHSGGGRLGKIDISPAQSRSSQHCRCSPRAFPIRAVHRRLATAAGRRRREADPLLRVVRRDQRVAALLSTRRQRGATPQGVQFVAPVCQPRGRDEGTGHQVQQRLSKPGVRRHVSDAAEHPRSRPGRATVVGRAAHTASTHAPADRAA